MVLEKERETYYKGDERMILLRQRERFSTKNLHHRGEKGTPPQTSSDTKETPSTKGKGRPGEKEKGALGRNEGKSDPYERKKREPVLTSPSGADGKQKSGKKEGPAKKRFLFKKEKENTTRPG